jgi:hypothetical protein
MTMTFELKARKERLEAELSGVLCGLKNMALEAWERKAMEAEAEELTSNLDHVNNSLAIYS